MYQRCMQRCLNEQIGRNVHVYVDDIVVMSRKKADLLEYLGKTFDNLWAYKMKLNPKKCVFGVPAGMLLGFIVSKRGIEVNPEKYQGNSQHIWTHMSERRAMPSRLFGCRQSFH